MSHEATLMPRASFWRRRRILTALLGRCLPYLVYRYHSMFSLGLVVWVVGLTYSTKRNKLLRTRLLHHLKRRSLQKSVASAVRHRFLVNPRLWDGIHDFGWV